MIDEHHIKWMLGHLRSLACQKNSVQRVLRRNSLSEMMLLFICLVLALIFPIGLSWEKKALQCWQCASVPGYATKCPQDASLYQLPEWNACMTWTLDRGNIVVLQNFVYSHNDCTKEKLDHWAEYIHRVWREPGTAKCCFEDECNNGSNVTQPSSLQEENNSQAAQVERKVDCSQCLSIPHAFCLAEPQNGPNLVRMDFDDMVEKMDSAHVCTCADGYIPIYHDIDGSLIRCHDPIIATSVIHGRCLRQSHCTGLANSICQDDPDVKLANGLPIKTCQCMSGYVDRKFGCDLDIVQPSENSISTKAVTEDEASIDADRAICSGMNETCALIENSICNLEQGICQCLEGFLPVYDDDQPMKLTWCKDPIVLTSTVGGYCLVPRHCSGLMGTICTDSNPGEGGTFKRCECTGGLKPALPDPSTGIVRRCIGPNEEGVLSLISQALFGENTSIDRLPIKVSLKLSEKAALESCKSTMTVVEMNEWIPSEQFELSRENVSDALMGVIQARLPSSALGHHGVLIRLMPAAIEIKGNFMYSLSLQRNRVMTIRKSFVDSANQRRETVQTEQLSGSVKWINSETYTGIWFLLKYGYIVLGIVGEHTVRNPLMAWRDDSPAPYDVGVAGLTSEGAAVFYGVDCPLMNKLTSFYPEGACTKDADCAHIPNTLCRREDEPEIVPNTTLTLLTCRCAEGYEKIPDPFRTIKHGCYDPIKKSLTVNARCLSDKHCAFLNNTECVPSLFDANLKTCRCKKGTLPMANLKDSGLVPGCEATEFAKLLTVDSCKRNFVLGATTQWIPVTVMKMPFRAAAKVYSMAFYVKFVGAANPVNTTIAIKLLDANQSPDKLYKITISTTGQAAIYENVQGSRFLFGTFNRESPQVVDSVIDPNEFTSTMYMGFWVRYHSTSGLVSMGRIGQDSALLGWTDTSNTALNGTEYVGFEVESGGNADFGAVCFDVI